MKMGGNSCEYNGYDNNTLRFYYPLCFVIFYRLVILVKQYDTKNSKEIEFFLFLSPKFNFYISNSMTFQIIFSIFGLFFRSHIFVSFIMRSHITYGNREFLVRDLRRYNLYLLNSSKLYQF